MPQPIQAVHTFDTRIQLRDTRLDTVPTRDGLQVVVQAYLLWKIDDTPDGVLRFYRRYGTIEAAADDLEVRLQDAKDVLSRYDFDELVGAESRLGDAEQAILARLTSEDDPEKSLASLGIRPVAVGFSQVLLPPETTKSVVSRMQEERRIRADAETRKGDAAYEAILSDGAGKAEAILNFAEAASAEIRRRGDELAAEAVRIMSEDPEFAIFLAWLDGFEKAAGQNLTVFVSDNMAPFHLLNRQVAQDGIPRPNGAQGRREEIRAASGEKDAAAGSADEQVEAEAEDGPIARSGDGGGD
jgi:membrane protease subunit HflC